MYTSQGLVADFSGFHSPTWHLSLPVHTSFSVISVLHNLKRKENFTLFSDHDGSLLRRQPGAMTRGHSPKRKEKYKKPKVDLCTTCLHGCLCSCCLSDCNFCSSLLRQPVQPLMMHLQHSKAPHQTFLPLPNVLLSLSSVQDDASSACMCYLTSEACVACQDISLQAVSPGSRHEPTVQLQPKNSTSVYAYRLILTCILGQAGPART